MRSLALGRHSPDLREEMLSKGLSPIESACLAREEGIIRCQVSLDRNERWNSISQSSGSPHSDDGPDRMPNQTNEVVWGAHLDRAGEPEGKSVNGEKVRLRRTGPKSG